jgi:hypothetical protein
MKNRIRTQNFFALTRLAAVAAVRRRRMRQSSAFAVAVVSLKLTPEVLARAEALTAFTHNAKRAAFLERYRAGH